MLGLLTAFLVAAPQNIINVRGGNALTLPAARHMVRLDPGDGRRATWLLAVQQDGSDGHWLSMYRSVDEARTWTWYAPIQDACCERDTPDLVQVGMDVAMVFSYEGPQISGSTEHDVYFQWWRWDGRADWIRGTKVKVFDSTSGATAYLRAELARDSLGRFWVWAQRLNADGTFTMVMSVSTDDGATFQAQPSLDNFANRPGGRILPVSGHRLMLIYSSHGGVAGYMRLRNDWDALSTWGTRETVFPEGIYHGAALSAAGDGSGGVHLVYKDSSERVFYRRWSGSWSARQLVESSADWAQQPAITRVGGSLVIFWNRVLSVDTNYQFYSRVLEGGTLGNPRLLDGSGGFKGYPAAVESLPNTVPEVPCVYGKTPNASTGGSVALVFSPTPNPAPLPPPPPPPDGGVPDAGTPDAGTPDAGSPDAGRPDAGTPDAGSPDAGTPDGGTPDGGPAPPQAGVLFSDDFNRTLPSDLGPKWTVVAGAWRADGTANSDRSMLDRAVTAGVSCADCRIDARMVNFGGGEAMLELRASGGDRYALALTAGGRLELRRYRAGVTTVLGSAPSGIADLKGWHAFSFTAQGSASVTLTAWVGGVPKISATDASASALSTAGAAGIAATASGILFDDFMLTGSGSVQAPPAPPDAGPPDAGPPDAGPPDAGVPDGGAPDAGAPGSGTTLVATVTYTETRFDLLAVDPSGTAYGVNLGVAAAQLWATVDGRSWSKRGATPDGAGFAVMTALSDGTLIADVRGSSGHALVRSTDHGVTWIDVLKTGQYRMLTPHSIAELDGAVYFAEYQSFTSGTTAIRLWKSLDRGQTWTVQQTFQGHRHAHGLVADPARKALWVYFGDRNVESGAYRSTDGGASWTAIVSGKKGDIIDAVVLPDGSLLCGQDISYQPGRPAVARIGLDGTVTNYVTLPSSSYSTHAIPTGGFVVGTTYEIDNDVSPAGWTRGSLWGSGDGVHWKSLLEVPRLASTEDVRTDVYWELATGELVVSVRNASGFGPGGRGYMLLNTTRQ
jgi:hypothetical protein